MGGHKCSQMFFETQYKRASLMFTLSSVFTESFVSIFLFFTSCKDSKTIYQTLLKSFKICITLKL